MAENEIEVVRPLNTEEIKDGIAEIVAVKVRESLNTTCYLHGSAYPKFKATWRVDITLENFGQLTETFVDGSTRVMGLPDGKTEFVPVDGVIEGDIDLTIDGDIPYTPPNVFRKQNHLAVPTVIVKENGNTEEQAVIYKRRPGRPKKVPDVE